LLDYLSDYQWIFRSKTKKFFDKAQYYTQGILQSQRNNIEQICETLGDFDYFKMQHFISESNWSARDAINQAAVQTSQVLPKRKLTGLILDETGVEKKGDKSVGVGWQYCGNVGKLANSQVAVMACLSNGDFASLVDARLYLTQDWINNPSRCDKAGIPLGDRIFKTKIEIAREIILHQLFLGTVFEFIGADGYYGNDFEFAQMIDQLCLVYILDIHSDQPVFLEKPELNIPPRKGNKGREPKLPKPNKESIKVSEYYKSLKVDQWQQISVRNTAKGKLKAFYHFVEVYVWHKESNQISKRLLVIRKIKTKNGDEIKYSFTNANTGQYTLKGLAYMQAQRFFIEHCIKESKYSLGLSQFQTRKWLAWQHQIALNIMVMCFILKEKLCCFDDLPLLSARDVKEYMCFVLTKPLSEDDCINKIFIRHYKRQTDINYSYSKVWG
jgi:SRSO17 transposase